MCPAFSCRVEIIDVNTGLIDQRFGVKEVDLHYFQTNFALFF